MALKIDPQDHDELDLEPLDPQVVDYVAAATRGLLGAVPFAGSLLAELADIVIPNQRVDRIVKYAIELEDRLSSLEQDFVKSQLSNENFTDLMEEGLRQAARSLSDERRQYIATLITNSLSSEDIEYQESKHLLRILDDLSDIEIIWLRSYYGAQLGYVDEFSRTHSQVLSTRLAEMGGSKADFDKATLQQSYREHLARLGLLEPRMAVDSFTGQPQVSYYELASLGELLLREIGLVV